MAPAHDESTITRMDSELFQAAVHGEIEVLQKKVNELQLLLTPEENTVLHVHIFAPSNTEKRSNIVEKIIDMCPPLLLKTNKRRETPILMAARHGHHLIVDCLIQRANIYERNDPERDSSSGVDNQAAQQMLGIKNVEEDTALHEAARFGHFKVVQSLMNQDPQLSSLVNEARETPLYIAVEAGYSELVEEILEKCPESATGGPMGRTALHAATVAGNIEIIQILLEKVPHLTKEKDDDGCIPLHYAVAARESRKNDFEIVKMLLEKDKSSGYISNTKGMTALHVAVSNRFIGDKIMNEFLLKCPDSYEVLDDEDKNVLHYAVMCGSVSKLQFILINSSHANYLLNRKDKAGNTFIFHIHPTSPWHVDILDVVLSDPRVNKMSFNKQHNNITDEYRFNYGYMPLVQRLFSAYSVKGYLRKPIVEDGQNDIEKMKKEVKEGIRSKTENNRASSLIAATLIATITFAAGFTLPGGYMSNEAGRPQQGSAILKNTTAFQAFMIADTIAMVLSTTSVCIILFQNASVFDLLDDESEFKYDIVCMLLTIGAMAFMIIAFVTGTYAVLSLSNPLAITTCLIGLSFFIIVFFILKSRNKALKFPTS